MWKCKLCETNNDDGRGVCIICGTNAEESRKYWLMKEAENAAKTLNVKSSVPPQESDPIVKSASPASPDTAVKPDISDKDRDISDIEAHIKEAELEKKKAKKSSLKKGIIYLIIVFFIFVILYQIIFEYASKNRPAKAYDEPNYSASLECSDDRDSDNIVFSAYYGETAFLSAEDVKICFA